MNRTCPSVEQLQQLTTGHLPDPPAADIESHLLECADCQQLTANLKLNDTFVDQVRQAARSGAEPAAMLDAADKVRVERIIDEASGLHFRERSAETLVTHSAAQQRADEQLAELASCWQPAEREDELGRLGGFRLLKLLGAGGMGVVFLAEDMQLQRRVALKTLKPEFAVRKDAAGRFLREARAAASVKHEHVVTIYQVGEALVERPSGAVSIPFLAQELLEGESLEDRLRRPQPLTVAEAVGIGRQMAEGLAAAHAKGLIHRDIKPANVWLERSRLAPRDEPSDDSTSNAQSAHHAERVSDVERSDDVHVKLLDFGLALPTDDTEHLTKSGMILGTPAYMAPEQAAEETVDARADLFSLGVVLYRMLTGRSPFQKANTIATLHALANFTPPSPCELNPDVPQPLSDFIDRLLQKDRNARPASAREVVRELTRSPVAPRPGLSSALDADTQLVAAPAVPPTKPSRRATRLRGWLIATALTGACVLCGVIIIKITKKDGTTLEVTVPDDTQKVEITESSSDRSASQKASASGRSTADVVAIPKLPVIPKASVTDASTSSTAKPLAPLPQLDLDETDPLPVWELPAGAPPPVVAPCEPTLAKERQQQWAEFLKRPVVEELDVAAFARMRGDGKKNDAKQDDNAQQTRVLANAATKDAASAATTLKLALIPPGEFRKIFTRSRDSVVEPDMPVRRFRITKPYAMSTTEVTWDQFRQFVEATGYQTEAETNGLGGRDREFKADPKITWRNPGWKPAPNEPVTQVTPRDAEAFCVWLTEAEQRKLPGNADDKTNTTTTRRLAPLGYFRLPTEAEWVHACRAGSVHKHVVGPQPGDLADYAWTNEFLNPDPQASPLHLVAQKKPNPFGLHDTLGNVWEYAQDWHSQSLSPYTHTNNPVGARSSSVCGSSWLHPANTVRPEFYVASFWIPTSNVGFRVLQQFDDEPLPGAGALDSPLVLRPGQPLSVHALVPRPAAIPGLRSWSVELAGQAPHTGLPMAIAASPRNDLIATAAEFGKISLWNQDGQYQRALLGHDEHIQSLDFSPDGQWLASCGWGSNNNARLWNVQTGALHAVIPLVGSPHRVTFSPSGEQLAVNFDWQYQTSFLTFDLKTGRIQMPSTSEQRGRGLAWSPDGSKIASLTFDSRLRIWDPLTFQLLQEIECPWSHSLEWSPDGQWLAMRNGDGKVAIRDAKTLEITNTFGPEMHAHAHVLAWLPDSRRLAVASGIQTSPSGIYNAVTGEQLAKFDQRSCYGITVIDEGQQAVLADFGRLRFYDTSTGELLREGRVRRSQGRATLSPDGSEVYFGQEGALHVSDAMTGEVRRQFQLPVGDWTVYPSLGGAVFAATTTFDPATLLLFESERGTRRHDMSHNKANVTRVTWSPDGRWLATGASDKLVRVWKVATGKIEHELSGHTGTIWSLAWSPDGTRLASAAEDKTVRLWDPLAGKLVATYDQFPEATNFGSGHSLAWTTNRQLWVKLMESIVPLDVETGTLGPLENFGNANYLTFLNTSPDGQRLLARQAYGFTSVRGRDAQDRRLLGQHLGQTAQWHPDSRRFLGHELFYGTVGFDVETNRRLGLLIPWISGDHWLCLGPTGHYRGSADVEDQIVYVAMHEDGSQRTYTPAEFAIQFAWKNDPDKAELLGK